MKITLTIDTSEPFYSVAGFESLVLMSLEEIMDDPAWHQRYDGQLTLDTQTGYLGGDNRKHIAKIGLRLSN